MESRGPQQGWGGAGGAAGRLGETMGDRRVTQTMKSEQGGVVALCNPGEHWSPRRRQDAIRDGEGGRERYYEHRPGTSPTYVEVARGSMGKYLRTARDGQRENNLDSLPDC